MSWLLHIREFYAERFYRLRRRARRAPVGALFRHMLQSKLVVEIIPLSLGARAVGTVPQASLVGSMPLQVFLRPDNLLVACDEPGYSLLPCTSGFG